MELTPSQRSLVQAMADGLFETAPFGLALFDPDLRFVRLNRFVARLNRRSPEEHLGKTFGEVRPDLAPVVEPLLRRVLELGEPVFDVPVSEDGTETESGVVHTIAVYYPVFGDEHGGAIGVGTIVVDVTMLRSLEEQLRRSQRLEAVGILAGGVAHDFNNLLTVISGHASLALAELPRSSPIRENVEGVVGAAERAAGVVRQLLAVARKGSLNPEVVDLDTEVREVAGLLRPVLGAAVELVTETGGAGAPLFVDRLQLQQVLFNLALNARDAMPDGGRITMRTLATTIDEATRSPELAPGAYVGVAVVDTGSGIAPEALDRVFEPFFTTKPADHGIGLGLSTAHGIVAQSGGAILVESTPGRGSTFRVLLPAAGAALGARPTQAAPAAVGGGSETILLVEDQPLVRELAQRLLRQLGYTVIVAEDGPQALALFDAADGAVELVLTDVSMPSMQGDELVRRLRESRPELPALTMSGYAEQLVHAIGEPTAFLAKPFSIDQLARAVRQALDAA